MGRLSKSTLIQKEWLIRDGWAILLFCFFTKKPCNSKNSCIFAAAIGYLARAVRDRSAKPGTAVRVRQVPQKKPAEKQAFFI